MSTSTSGSGKPNRSGRRAGYAKPAEVEGPTRYIPSGWANWIGFVMFAALTIAVAVEVVVSISESRGSDPVMAGILGCLFGWMTYLFATNRIKD